MKHHGRLRHEEAVGSVGDGNDRGSGGRELGHGTRGGLRAPHAVGAGPKGRLATVDETGGGPDGPDDPIRRVEQELFGDILGLPGAALEEEGSGPVRRHAEPKRHDQGVEAHVLGELRICPTGLQVDGEPSGAGGLDRIGQTQHQVDLAGQHEVAAQQLGPRTELTDGRELAPKGLQGRERRLEERHPTHDLHEDVVLIVDRHAGPVLREAFLTIEHAPESDPSHLMGIQGFTGADLDLDGLVEQDAVRSARRMGERRRSARDGRLELPLAACVLVELLLPEPERLAELQLANGLFDAIAEPLRKIGRERGTIAAADQALHGALLRIGELHLRMVRIETDMAETPDDILRALADPQRLAIAGALAAGDRSAAELAVNLTLPVARIRKHLNRLTTTGVVRLNDDRRTYRLDAETLRWAAEQAGPTREAGLTLGAANEEEEAVLRTFFRGGRLTEIPTKASKRHIVLERIAVEFEPGVRYEEKEVNVIVGRFFNDYASLRRYLVDEGLLERDQGIYWRVGGRVDL
jgi:hypothetical protein